MILLRIAFATALLASASVVAVAQPTEIEMGRREQAANLTEILRRNEPRRVGETADDLYNRLNDEAVARLRPQWDTEDRAAGTAPAGTPAQRPGEEEMTRRVAAIMPHLPDDTPERFNADVRKQVEYIMEPFWKWRAELPVWRAAREADADRSIRGQGARVDPSYVQRVRQGVQQAVDTTEQRRVADAELRFNSFADSVRRQNEYVAWKQANPEEAARRERLAAAQTRREQEQQRRLTVWQVVHPSRRSCQPLEEAITGVTDPDQALAAIRRVDPDAGFQGSGWHGREGNVLPWVVIETTTEPVLLAKDYHACNSWFRASGR